MIMYFGLCFYQIVMLPEVFGRPLRTMFLLCVSMNIVICFYCSFGLVNAVFICCCNLCFFFLGHLLVQLVLPLCLVDTFVLLLCHTQ